MLAVKVVPRSRRNELRIDGTGAKIWTTAAPTDGQANEAVCRIVAEHLDIAKSFVSVRRGHTSTSKLLHIDGLTDEELQSKLHRP